MEEDRGFDIALAGNVLGNRVIKLFKPHSLFMYAKIYGKKHLIPLPNFFEDDIWQDAIILEIMKDSGVKLDCRLTPDGWLASFSSSRKHNFCPGKTEQEALCRAALAYRDQFPRNK